MPELRAARRHVTPADLFAFDVAATARYNELQRDAQADEQARAQGRKPSAKLDPTPTTPSRAAVVEEHGENLAIHGNEIPPWDPRYRGPKHGKTKGKR